MSGETRLSTKGRYVTRALLDLAIHQREEPIPLKDIAQRQQISIQYLEHLITLLIAGVQYEAPVMPEGNLVNQGP